MNYDIKISNTDDKAVVDVPFDAETSDVPFGKRWGAQTIRLTDNDLLALQAGKLIAVDVMNEYVIYLQLDKNSK
jgi:hypothetical protein